MAVRLYMDHHVMSAITNGLRQRDVDILTAYEDGSHQLDDSSLLDRASVLGRVVFTHDDDFLVEAVTRQRNGNFFAGVIYMHQMDVTIGQCIHDLEIIAKVSDPEDFVNQVVYLPL